jgi:hypothetical protein
MVAAQGNSRHTFFYISVIIYVSLFVNFFSYLLYTLYRYTFRRVGTIGLIGFFSLFADSSKLPSYRYFSARYRNRTYSMVLGIRTTTVRNTCCSVSIFRTYTVCGRLCTFLTS